jgi:hypothetical protein
MCCPQTQRSARLSRNVGNQLLSDTQQNQDFIIRDHDLNCPLPDPWPWNFKLLSVIGSACAWLRQRIVKSVVCLVALAGRVVKSYFVHV